MDAVKLDAININNTSLEEKEIKSLKPNSPGIKMMEKLTLLSLLNTPATIESNTTTGKMKIISKKITKTKNKAA